MKQLITAGALIDHADAGKVRRCLLDSIEQKGRPFSVQIHTTSASVCDTVSKDGESSMIDVFPDLDMAQNRQDLFGLTSLLDTILTSTALRKYQWGP